MSKEDSHFLVYPTGPQPIPHLHFKMFKYRIASANCDAVSLEVVLRAIYSSNEMCDCIIEVPIPDRCETVLSRD